jgi:hypothetical protein
MQLFGSDWLILNKTPSGNGGFGGGLESLNIDSEL